MSNLKHPVCYFEESGEVKIIKVSDYTEFENNYISKYKKNPIVKSKSGHTLNYRKCNDKQSHFYYTESDISKEDKMIDNQMTNWHFDWQALIVDIEKYNDDKTRRIDAIDKKGNEYEFQNSNICHADIKFREKKSFNLTWILNGTTPSTSYIILDSKLCLIKVTTKWWKFIDKTIYIDVGLFLGKKTETLYSEKCIYFFCDLIQISDFLLNFNLTSVGQVKFKTSYYNICSQINIESKKYELQFYHIITKSSSKRQINFDLAHINDTSDPLAYNHYKVLCKKKLDIDYSNLKLSTKHNFYNPYDNIAEELYKKPITIDQKIDKWYMIRESYYYDDDNKKKYDLKYINYIISKATRTSEIYMLLLLGVEYKDYIFNNPCTSSIYLTAKQNWDIYDKTKKDNDKITQCLNMFDSTTFAEKSED